MASKKNLITLLGIAFVVAVIATGLFYGLVVSKLDKAAADSRDSIAVASRLLEPGHILTPADVELVPRTSVDVLADGFSSDTQLTGLVLMASVDEGDVLDRSILASKSSYRGAALGVPPGMRAVSVHAADSSGVVKLLREGHRVDAQIVSKNGRRGVTLRTVLQNLAVLRVEEEPESSEGRPVLPVVTLLATPEEADALAIADAAARIRLILRHPLDDELTERGGVVLSSVLTNPPRQKNQGASVSKSPGASKVLETASVTQAAAVHSEP